MLWKISKEERILYKMTVEDQIANSAKKVSKIVA